LPFLPKLAMTSKKNPASEIKRRGEEEYKTEIKGPVEVVKALCQLITVEITRK
jgi:hypothetical protein